LAINWAQFNINMQAYTSSYISTGMSEYVSFLLTQLDLALLTATNVFGQKLVKTNITISKPQAKSLIELERIAGYKNDMAIINVIANSISTGLMGSILLPLPPLPPAIVPNPALPNIITYGGNIELLKQDLKRSLMNAKKIKTPQMAMSLLTLSLQKFLLTVSGYYNGLIYAGTVLVPSPPIPWVGLI